MKKLKLNKETVSLLNNDKMKQINGGDAITTKMVECKTLQCRESINVCKIPE